jgi:hypothetical protein
VEATSRPAARALPALERMPDWGSIATWVLAFVLVVYLGTKGGGFDPLVSDQVGIAVWWLLLFAVLVGAVPRQELGGLAWLALGLFAGFVAWTALSLLWTESLEATWTELARVAGYLGVFALGVLARGPQGARRMVGAVGAAIAVVAVVALLSRLHPAWFGVNETAQFLKIGRERLSYPLNYWNALAAMIAIGMPLLLATAVSARNVVLRSLAAAAMPALMLTALFTLSRGGIAAIFVSIAIFFALAGDRLPKLLTLLVTGAGGAVLCLGALSRDDLRHGLETSSAHSQGNSLLVWTIVVCAVVGLVQAGISTALERGHRPEWTRMTREQSLVLLGVAVVAVIVGLVAVNAPHRISNAWDEFKLPEVPGKGTERLSHASGESRYQFWSSALREFESAPVGGTGSGTFQYWWPRDGDTPDVVRDAHSLYFQTLGELGLVGAVLLIGFFLTLLVGGGIAAVRAGPKHGVPLAAAVGGVAAFCFTAIFDWMWQVPVLPVAMLLLGSVLVTRAVSAEGASRSRPFGLWTRIGIAVASLIVVVAIAIPLASESLVRESQSKASAGDNSAALADARSAQNVEPGAAAPRLQEALVLESEGELDAAAAAALAAVERESTNWRLWMVRSRIEAERGNAQAAVAFYRKARSLNPNSPFFEAQPPR